MKKKETTTTNDLGICEKLFNAFNPALRPLRRLSFRHFATETTTNPSPTLTSDSNPKDPSPIKPPPAHARPELVAPEKKPAEVVATKAGPHTAPPQPATREKEKDAAPPPISQEKPKVPPSATATKGAADHPSPAPPSSKVAAPTPPPPAAVPQVERPKKNINDKADDYINRAKAKIRTGSSVGRPL